MTPSEEKARRRLLKLCDTREELHAWVYYYLDLDLPGCVVDEDSNTSMLDSVWLCYSHFRFPDPDTELSRVLIYAGRDGGKTLTQSVFEVLLLLHFRESIVHLAAIEEQSTNAARYLKTFFSKPALRGFIVGDSKRSTEIVTYQNKSGLQLTEAEWKKLPEPEQVEYEFRSARAEIVVATMASVNGKHANLAIDELDVIGNPTVYHEAQNIPTPRKLPDGTTLMPLTVLTSTRKTAFGLVQDEINRAKDTGLLIKHWNVLDVTEACPAKRHRPDLPKLPIYRSTETLTAVSEKAYEMLPQKEKDHFVKDEGFHGCINNCRIFGFCKGKLATHQKSDSKFLKPITHIQNMFKTQTLDMFKAQQLCRKPSSFGLVYARFDRNKHVLTPAQAYEKIFGEECPKEAHLYTKQELVTKVNTELNPAWYGGMDFGFSHNFSWSLAPRIGKRMFVMFSNSTPQLEPEQQVADLEPYKYLNPTIFGDPENPQMIKVFKKNGFSMKSFSKGKGSVTGGISVVQLKLNPSGQEPELFFVIDVNPDPGMEFLVKQMMEYHWKKDATGRPLPIPEKTEDDACFDLETEALTQRGWIKKGEFTEDDFVWAVSPDGIGHWEKPSRVIRKNHTGFIYKADHHHLSFVATDDHAHAVMTQFNWKVKKNYLLEKRTVDEMVGEMYWANNLREWPEGEGLFKQGPDEAWMAGFWIAEGCFDTGRPTFLLFDQTKTAHQETFRETANRLGWTFSETYRPRKSKIGVCTRFCVSRQGERADEWFSLFNEHSYAKKLNITDILKMTKNEREQFWEGYMAGDGCRTDGSSWHFDSVSKDLIEGIQLLTLSLGYGCRVVSYDCMKAGPGKIHGREVNKRQIYRGYVLRKKPVAHINKKDFEKIEVKDMPVWCITTSTGMFFARRNGMPFVAGQCDQLRYMVMNVFDPKGLTVAAHASENTPSANPDLPRYHELNWMQQKIEELTGGNPSGKFNSGDNKSKKSTIIWNLD
jgi:hypothetical protein